MLPWPEDLKRSLLTLTVCLLVACSALEIGPDRKSGRAELGAARDGAPQDASAPNVISAMA